MIYFEAFVKMVSVIFMTLATFYAGRRRWNIAVFLGICAIWGWLVSK
jgi:hypothetical protein